MELFFYSGLGELKKSASGTRKKEEEELETFPLDRKDFG